MKRTGIGVVALLALSWSVQSHAVLIDLGGTTRDTATGLEWLDVNLTAGLTYSQVLGGAGGYTFSGWRFATGAELDALATRYIGSPEQTFSAGLDFIQTLIMIGLLEPTFQHDLDADHPSTIATLGYYNDGTNDPLVGLGEFTVTLLVPDPAFGTAFTGRWTTFDDFLGSNEVWPQIGSFLVRSVAVPEPSTLALLLVGVAGMALTRRRKRKSPRPAQEPLGRAMAASGRELTSPSSKADFNSLSSSAQPNAQ